MFSLLIVFVTTIASCNKQELSLLDQESPDNNLENTSIQNASLSKLIYEETFEGATPLSSFVSKQMGTSHAFSVVSSPVFEGKRSGRFELRDTDPLTSNGTRTEVKFPELTHPERWYSFSVYLPASDYLYDSKAEILNQWHQSGGASPSISLITRYDHLYLETRNDPKVKKQVDLGPLVKNKWRTYVLHIIHSNSSDGFIEIWQDGVKILTQSGANSYSFSSFDKPKWKVGIYKWDWNGDETTDTKKRVVFFDNIRLGNENATYADMVSSGNGTPSDPAPSTPSPNPPVPKPTPPVATPPTPTPPTPTPPVSSDGGVTDFTLINADTEKDVRPLKDGDVINLAASGLNKLNVRANLAGSDKSVLFELSGPQTYKSKDSGFPFALFGDDGKGNYYYGIWKKPSIVPGKYTLKATSYSGTKATGTPGKPVVISFTVSN